MKRLSNRVREVIGSKETTFKNLKLLPNEKSRKAQVLQKGHNKQINEG